MLLPRQLPRLYVYALEDAPLDLVTFWEMHRFVKYTTAASLERWLNRFTTKQKELTVYRNGPSLWGIIYIVIGIFVAANRGYLGDLSTISGIFSALLAIILWPLLLFGVNLHLSIG
jgi:hypothetical protein